jgi:sugar O-acyltransferase (sialic acid O-acetyltransferase NeuD family)
MNKLVLIGGGGHCKSVIDVIEQEGRFQIAGIVDKPELLGSSVLGYPIIGSDSDLSSLANEYKYAFIAIGQIKSPSIRIDLFNQAIDAGFVLPIIVSPRAYVSRSAKLDEGTIIMHDALVNASASIGKNCIINSKALIEHDSNIESFCHISTNAVINGSVIVRQGSFVGSGAVTKQCSEIKKNSFIKAGSLFK